MQKKRKRNDELTARVELFFFVFVFASLIFKEAACVTGREFCIFNGDSRGGVLMNGEGFSGFLGKILIYKAGF